MSETQFDWWNGEIVERENTKTDQLWLAAYGVMAWEGMKSYEWTVFQWREHFERLHRSCRHLGEVVSFGVNELLSWTHELLQRNWFTKWSYYIRPQVSFWEGQIGISSKEGTQNVIIRAVPYSNTQRNMRLAIVPEVRKVHMPNPNNPDLYHKVPSNYRFARETIRLAKERGFDDGVNLDQNGNISEWSVTNIFFIDEKNKRIHTPKQWYIFPGITRWIIVEILGPQLWYEVVERDIHPEEIAEFDECFLCWTASEISTVSEINLGQSEKKFTTTTSSLSFAEAYSMLVNSK